MKLMSGAMLGDYVIVKRLGSGGMAEVFSAYRRGLDGFLQPVALKCLHAEAAEDEEFLQQFINEAYTGSRLQHPNIVAIQDFNKVDGVYYLAMEYVDGVDLQTLICHLRSNERRLAPPLAAYVAKMVLKALGYAYHNAYAGDEPARVIHRDIKPANIMINRLGQVKVADFGIAKAPWNPHITRADKLVKGTLPYMSPEQLVGNALSSSSDLFSVGTVLYEMLAFQRLFRGRPVTQLIERIQRADVVEQLRALSAETPEFIPILTRALMLQPEDRFEDARSFGNALEPLEASERELAILARDVTSIVREKGILLEPAAPSDCSRPGCQVFYETGDSFNLTLDMLEEGGEWKTSTSTRLPEPPAISPPSPGVSDVVACTPEESSEAGAEAAGRVRPENDADSTASPDPGGAQREGDDVGEAGAQTKELAETSGMKDSCDVSRVAVTSPLERPPSDLENEATPGSGATDPLRLAAEKAVDEGMRGGRPMSRARAGKGAPSGRPRRCTTRGFHSREEVPAWPAPKLRKEGNFGDKGRLTFGAPPPWEQAAAAVDDKVQSSPEKVRTTDNTAQASRGTLHASRPSPAGQKLVLARRRRAAYVAISVLCLGLSAGSAEVPVPAEVAQAAAPIDMTLPEGPGSSLWVQGAEVIEIPGGEEYVDTAGQTHRIKTFFIDRDKVTVGQYLEFLKSCPPGSGCGPSEAPGFLLELAPEKLAALESAPVTFVSFRDAKVYAAWRGGRLPTPAEWEKAADGAVLHPYTMAESLCLHPGAAEDYCATIRPPDKGRAIPLGLEAVQTSRSSSPLSAYGVFAMHTRIKEWTESPERAGAQSQLLMGGEGEKSGGATSQEGRLANVGTRTADIGFRCVLDPEKVERSGRVLAMERARQDGVLHVGMPERENVRGRDCSGLETFEREMIRTIAAKRGLEADIVKAPRRNLGALLADGKVDVILGGFRSADSVPGVSWSAPYLEGGLSVVVPARGSGARSEGWAVGYGGLEEDRQLVKEWAPRAVPVSLETGDIGRLLEKRRIDAALVETPVAVDLVSSGKKVFKVAEFNVNRISYQVGVREGEWSSWIWIDDAVRTFRSSPDYEKLLVEHMGGRTALSIYGLFEADGSSVEPSRVAEHISARDPGRSAPGRPVLFTSAVRPLSSLP